MRRITQRVVFATVVLVVAVAGAALAAGSITGKSIKDGTITGKDIKNGAVSGKDVKNHSLTKKDFRGSVRGPRGYRGSAGPAGPQGPQGPQGPRGAQGPAGPSLMGQVTTVQSAQVPFGDPTSPNVEGATAFCPSGQRVISGGGVSISDEQLAATEPTSDRSGWFVIGIDSTGSSAAYVQAVALCAPTGRAVAAATSRSKVRRQVAAVVTKVQRQVDAR